MTYDTTLGPSPDTPAGGEEVVFLRQLRARGGVVVWWPTMRVKHCIPPERATLAYLARFTTGKGREYVLDSWTEPEQSSLILDAPRWLWKAWAIAAGRYLVASCGLRVRLPDTLRSGPHPPPDSSPHVRRLVCLRERLYLAGMLKAFSDHRHAPVASGSDAGNPEASPHG